MFLNDKIQTLLFDLDGTLIDSWLDIALSVNHTLTSVQLPERDLDEIKTFIGDGVVHLIQRSLGEEQLHQTNACLEIFKPHYEEHCLDHTALYSDVLFTLEAFKDRYMMCVLTNKPYHFSKIILEQLKIEHYFHSIIGGDTCSQPKPDPEGILTLSQKTGTPVSGMVMIGDHYVDILTGKNAGCPTIFCKYGIGRLQEQEPDASIDSLKDLIQLLA